MGYGQNLKPLVVGIPLEIKKEIGRVAKEQEISEAEVIRRLCAFFLNNPSLLDLALKKTRQETVSEEMHFSHCNPTRFMKIQNSRVINTKSSFNLNDEAMK